MDQILLIVAGLLGGLLLIAVIVGIAVLWARRDERSKRSWLADPSGRVDHGPSVGSDSGPDSSGGHAG